MRSLYNRARGITMQMEDLKEEDYLMSVFRINGYQSCFIRSVTSHTILATQPTADNEEEKERTPPLTIPYVAGISESIRSL